MGADVLATQGATMIFTMLNRFIRSPHVKAKSIDNRASSHLPRNDCMMKILGFPTIQGKFFPSNISNNVSNSTGFPSEPNTRPPSPSENKMNTKASAFSWILLLRSFFASSIKACGKINAMNWHVKNCTIYSALSSNHGRPWWRLQMETFSALLAIWAGNSPVTGEFPARRPVTRSFAVWFDLRLNKRLSKQSGGWWFETPSRPFMTSL